MDLSVRDQGLYAFGPFRLDPLRRVLTRNGVVVALSPKVFDALLYLVENPDRLLDKDELLSAIWPGRVVEESNISQTISTLRKALSAAGQDERYIVTAPGRGYRFASPVRRVAWETVRPDAAMQDDATPEFLPIGDDASIAPDGSKVRSRRSRPGALLLGCAIVAAALAGAYVATQGWSSGGKAAERNSVLLMDFLNQTGDPAFDTVLGKVLEIDLAQSPYVSILSPQQVSKTLQLMERPKDARLTPELAQEVCARNQGAAMLNGSITALGSRYVVTLEARDCVSAGLIAQSKAEAARKEDAPSVLDGLILQIRRQLDESLASIRRFDAPIAQATTASFEALTAFSLGEKARAQGDIAGSLPLYKHAIELDPSFVLAYEQLGGAYVGLREVELGKSFYQKAFQLRDRTSEIERLRITANYYYLLGDFMDGVRSYQLWTETYPREWEPWASLSNDYTRMALYPEAIEAGKQALRLNPEHGRPYIVLARAYKRSTRFDEAEAIGRQATAKGLDGWDMHCLLYEVAFARGDAAAMANQVARERGKPTEPWMLDYEGSAAATEGKVRQFRALFEQAITAAEAQGPDSREEVSDFFIDFIDLAADLGLMDEARKLADKATGLEQNDEAPFAIARSGDFARAAALAATLGERYPANTEVNDVYRPMTAAAIALGQGRPQDAIRALKPAMPYEMRDFDVPSLLGKAYLATNAPELAAVEYRKILDNRGLDGVSPLYPLAYLGLARAQRMLGKPAESAKTYEQLFAFWKDADEDMPILQEARREYDQLTAEMQSTASR